MSIFPIVLMHRSAVKASGPTGGAGNGTYYGAYVILVWLVISAKLTVDGRYVYFEKVRIAQGKKKTAKRERNEIEHPMGFELRERKGMWVVARR